MSKNTVLDAEKINCLLKDLAVPPVRVYDCTDSTNILAKDAGQAGAAEWSCFAAAEQSAGRGRRGRSFYSPKGSGIYFSILLRPSLTGSLLTMLTTAAAVAVCLASEDCFGISPEIKWVNDVFYRSKKICGILTEAVFNTDGSVKYAVVGVGVNLFAPDRGFPADIADTAGCLLDGRRDGAADSFIAAFIRRYIQLCSHIADDSEALCDEYRRRCFVIGKNINILFDGKVIASGVAEDIDRFCRLKVRYADGTSETISSGEISIRVKQEKIQ